MRGAALLAADDECLDVVPAVAIGGIRDALLERLEELGEETGGAVLALERERAVQERPAAPAAASADGCVASNATRCESAYRA